MGLQGFRIAWKVLEPKVKNLLVEVGMLFVSDWVVDRGAVSVTEGWKDQGIWEVVGEKLGNGIQ